MEVAVLRLSAGAKSIRHTGSSNARLTIHFGLQLPEGGVSALAGDEFRLMCKSVSFRDCQHNSSGIQNRSMASSVFPPCLALEVRGKDPKAQYACSAS
jgi:hypothetical protein